MTVLAQRRLFHAAGESRRPEAGPGRRASGSVRRESGGEEPARGGGALAPGLALYVPSGWPEGVHPPGVEGWEATVTAFLLDCCPADYRSYAVLRRHPVVLARFAAEFVESQVRACREGLGEARASLGAVVSPEVVEAATQAWLEQEAALKRRRREVALVEEALRGKVFVRKM